MTKKVVYWDANCFLGLLQNEAEKVARCRYTTEQAEQGNLLIITSAITFIEVIKIKGKPKLKRSAENTIRQFFENPFIYIHDVDREVGIKARDLMWKHAGLKPKDAIHVATAILRKVPIMHTFDDDLIKLSGKYGDPRLIICQPEKNPQGRLFGDQET